MRTAKAIWWFFIVKFVELLDTFFIICKGNYRQLTFLHIYHHASVIAWWWIGAKVTPCFRTT